MWARVTLPEGSVTRAVGRERITEQDYQRVRRKKLRTASTDSSIAEFCLKEHQTNIQTCEHSLNITKALWKCQV